MKRGSASRIASAIAVIDPAVCHTLNAVDEWNEFRRRIPVVRAPDRNGRFGIVAICIGTDATKLIANKLWIEPQNVCGLSILLASFVERGIIGRERLGQAAPDWCDPPMIMIGRDKRRIGRDRRVAARKALRHCRRSDPHKMMAKTHDRISAYPFSPLCA